MPTPDENVETAFLGRRDWVDLDHCHDAMLGDGSLDGAAGSSLAGCRGRDSTLATDIVLAIPHADWNLAFHVEHRPGHSGMPMAPV